MDSLAGLNPIPRTVGRWLIGPGERTNCCFIHDVYINNTMRSGYVDVLDEMRILIMNGVGICS